MKKRLVASLLLVAMLSVTYASSVEADLLPVQQIHTVQPGETWQSIADSHGISLWTLGYLNGYSDNAFWQWMFFSQPTPGRDVVVGIQRTDVPVASTATAAPTSSGSPNASASPSASASATASASPTASASASAAPSATPSASASQPTAVATPSYVMRERTHTVKKGDTLYSLAKYYGTTVDQLKKWNPTVKEKDMSIGSKLIVGYLLYDSTASIPPDPDILPSGYYNSSYDLKHKVQAGDTVYSIAKTYGLTVKQLKAMNPSIGKKNIIKIGQDIVVGHESVVVNGYATPIPTPTPTIYPYNYGNSVNQYTNYPTTPSSSASKGGYYTVQAGDYLYKIAKENGLTLAQIKDLNPGVSSAISPGQQIRIK